MNLSPRWVEALGNCGITAVHWSSVGDHGASDAEIFEEARTRRSVVFTNDLDFSAILSQRRASKPSVVQLRAADVTPMEHGKLVAGVLKKYADEINRGAIVTIEPGRARVRILPL